MFVLQILQVYITNLNSSAGVIAMEKEPPHNLEVCIGTILACRNKVDIDELSSVCFFYISNHQICQILDGKYNGKISMLQNSGDARIIEHLAPSVPSNVDVETTLKQVLNSHGIDYGTLCPYFLLQDPYVPISSNTFPAEQLPSSFSSAPAVPQPPSFTSIPAVPQPLPFSSIPAVPPSQSFSSIPAESRPSIFPTIPPPPSFTQMSAGPAVPQNAGMGARFPPPAAGFDGETAGKRPPLNTSPRSAPGGGLFPALCIVC